MGFTSTTTFSVCVISRQNEANNKIPFLVLQDRWDGEISSSLPVPCVFSADLSHLWDYRGATACVTSPRCSSNARWLIASPGRCPCPLWSLHLLFLVRLWPCCGSRVAVSSLHEMQELFSCSYSEQVVLAPTGNLPQKGRSLETSSAGSSSHSTPDLRCQGPDFNGTWTPEGSGGRLGAPSKRRLPRSCGFGSITVCLSASPGT